MTKLNELNQSQRAIHDYVIAECNDLTMHIDYDITARRQTIPASGPSQHTVQCYALRRFELQFPYRLTQFVRNIENSLHLSYDLVRQINPTWRASSTYLLQFKKFTSRWNKLQNLRSLQSCIFFKNQIKSSLYSRYYTKARNEWWVLSPRLSAWTTQLRRNIARWRVVGDAFFQYG